MKPLGHSSLTERKQTGSHYTPKSLSDFVARQMLLVWAKLSAAKTVRVLDPAIGDGQLITSVIAQLQQHGIRVIEVLGFDTDSDAVDFAKARLIRQFPKLRIDIRCQNFLDYILLKKSNDLFVAPISVKSFDLIISNPPYIRTQILGRRKAQALAQQFGLSGRVDLYYAFLLSLNEMLNKNGVLGIIVSNRFMSTQSGQVVRRELFKKYDVLEIVDFGDTKIFEAAVLPAVLIMKKKTSINDEQHIQFTQIYSTDSIPSATPCKDIFQAIQQNGVFRINGTQYYKVQKGILNPKAKNGDVWRLSNEQNEHFLSTVMTYTKTTFGDVGKIRVGVKTTADKVFIRTNWDQLPESNRPELLFPLITHHIANRFHAFESQKEILYPHEVVNGKRVAVNLGKYPNTKAYLEAHQSELKKRTYVTKSGRQWYEIWVPHHPDLWKTPKLVFRDIVDKPTFWYDHSGAIVNGDCYWMTLKQGESDDWLWLALAVGNSTFIETFYDHRFNNKLYAGRRRFMTQYVEKFPLPDLNTPMAKKIVSITKQIFKQKLTNDTSSLEEQLDGLVWQVFGLSDQKN